MEHFPSRTPERAFQGTGNAAYTRLKTLPAPGQSWKFELRQVCQKRRSPYTPHLGGKDVANETSNFCKPLKRWLFGLFGLEV